jgi:oligopeptide/dipeptide ABC transporter ATP-binding protein
MLLTQKTELSHEKPTYEPPLLRVSNLKISFVTRAGKIQAINDVSFDLKPGETLGLVGETGCGKSQTALAVMRLTPEAGIIERGEIWFSDTNLTKNIAQEFKLVETHGRVKLRRNKSMLDKLNHEVSEIRGRAITMIFQEPMTSLNPVYTIGRQLSETLLRHCVPMLVNRVLARNAATKEKLKAVSKTIIEVPSHAKVRELLEQNGLGPLEDQVQFILSRRDIGIPQKSKAIMALGDKKLKPLTERFLISLKKHNDKIPSAYRIASRLPVLRRWLWGTIEQEALEVSYELLSLVNMPNAETVLRQYPHELSGGMRQRVMIAMAIATRPKLVIADEPTSALDVTVQAQILELLRGLKGRFNAAILFISHDLGVISEICDRVGVMYAGNLVEVATLDQLFADPKHPYTQGLLASIPTYGEKKEMLRTIEGNVPNLIAPPKGCRFRTRCSRAFDKCAQGPPWVQIDEQHGVLCWLYGDSAKHIDQ